MSVDWNAVSVFHFILPLTCFCQSVDLIFVCLPFNLFPSVFLASSCFVFPNVLFRYLIPVLWWMWPFGTSSYLYIFYLPVPLISLSDCAPYFHISPLSFFVSFLLSAVHIKHWHQIDSHVNKAAVGGQGPLPQALKLLPILFTASPPLSTPSIPPLGLGGWEKSKHTKYYFAMSEANKPILPTFSSVLQWV